MISKSASESGSTAKLICRAQGTPNVTFTWKREGSVIEHNFDSDYRHNRKRSKNAEKELKYIIEETKKLDLITYQSVLIINYVTSADYGSYDCVARNDLGFDAFAIVLNHTSRPDPPRSLRVVNVTSGSVTLRWIPGFDGGLEQSFRIRYKPAEERLVDDPSYLYRDVYPPNATTATIGGLRDDTQYIFSVMAGNEKGDSEFVADQITTFTLKGRFRQRHSNH